MTGAQGNVAPKRADKSPRESRRLLALPRQGRVYNLHGAHSRTVQLMRLLLPAAALVLIAIVLLWSQWQTIEGGFRIGFSLISPEEAKTLRMVKARFSGMTRKGRPYLVTADEAVRAAAAADRIHLSNLKGDITTESGAWVMMMAPFGIYHETNKTLHLSGGVDLFHDKGLHFTSPTARVDLKTGFAEGHESATAVGPSVDISGDGFKVLEKGRKVIFTGAAKAILYPSDKRERAVPPERPAR